MPQHDTDASSLPFTSSDTAYLDARFSGQTSRRKQIYDIRMTDDGGNRETRDTLFSGAVKLTSRNLGYDFALVKVEGGRGLFGAQRDVVEIHIKKRGDWRYSYLRTAANLRKALNIIDRIYEEAAEGHLP